MSSFTGTNDPHHNKSQQPSIYRTAAALLTPLFCFSLTGLTKEEECALVLAGVRGCWTRAARTGRNAELYLLCERLY